MLAWYVCVCICLLAHELVQLPWMYWVNINVIIVFCWWMLWFNSSAQVHNPLTISTSSQLFRDNWSVRNKDSPSHQLSPWTGKKIVCTIYAQLEQHHYHHRNVWGCVWPVPGGFSPSIPFVCQVIGPSDLVGTFSNKKKNLSHHRCDLSFVSQSKQPLAKQIFSQRSVLSGSRPTSSPSPPQFVHSHQNEANFPLISLYLTGFSLFSNKNQQKKVQLMLHYAHNFPSHIVAK